MVAQLHWDGELNKKNFTSVLNEMSKINKKKWKFINGGVGNYNAERYVNNFLENWSDLAITDIIIHFFVNDTELSTVSNQTF